MPTRASLIGARSRTLLIADCSASRSARRWTALAAGGVGCAAAGNASRMLRDAMETTRLRGIRTERKYAIRVGDPATPVSIGREEVDRHTPNANFRRRPGDLVRGGCFPSGRMCV